VKKKVFVVNLPSKKKKTNPPAAMSATVRGGGGGVDFHRKGVLRRKETLPTESKKRQRENKWALE